MSESWKMFSHKVWNEKRKEFIFEDTHPNSWFVKLFDKSLPVVSVKVTVDNSGDYWGFIYAQGHQLARDEGCPDSIWRTKEQLDITFAYGVKKAEERGDGYVVRLRVEEIIGEDQ